jgi:glycosyltransferase involved in cell wall biosynthesis
LSYENGSLLKEDNLINFFKNIYTVKKSAQEHEVVHAFDGWPHAFYGLCAVLGTSKRLFINAVGTYSIAPLDGKLIKKILLTCAYRRATIIFAISTFVAKELKKRIKDIKVKVVHLGTTRIHFELNFNDNLLLTELSGRNPVVLTVGALKKRKGQLDTLKAVVSLKIKYPNIVYVALGDTSDVSYTNALRTYAKENDSENLLLIRGEVEEGELAFWYHKADLFALNSVNHDGHFEGFGLVILEAAQYGVPAVGSGGCGIEDAILDGKTGYLAKQSNVEDIAEKIDRLLSKKMNPIAIKEFASSFDWDQTTKQYIEAYQLGRP